jgi:ERCC4-type nuclease
LGVLESCDASFLGNFAEGQFPIGVEVKRLSTGDLWDSIASGRLIAGQLPKAAEHYKRAYLIVEGYWRAGTNGEIEIPEWTNFDARKHSIGWEETKRNLRYRMLDNWLNSLSELSHVVVKRSCDITETAQQILDLYMWWSKSYELHKSLQAFDESRVPVSLFTPSLVRRVAKELGGLGWIRSEAADKHFTTVEQMVLASPEQWMEVEGVGKKLSTQIFKELRGQK